MLQDSMLLCTVCCSFCSAASPEMSADHQQINRYCQRQTPLTIQQSKQVAYSIHHSKKQQCSLICGGTGKSLMHALMFHLRVAFWGGIPVCQT